MHSRGAAPRARPCSAQRPAAPGRRPPRRGHGRRGAPTVGVGAGVGHREVPGRLVLELEVLVCAGAEKGADKCPRRRGDHACQEEHPVTLNAAASGAWWLCPCMSSHQASSHAHVFVPGPSAPVLPCPGPGARSRGSSLLDGAPLPTRKLLAVDGLAAGAVAAGEVAALDHWGEGRLVPARTRSEHWGFGVRLRPQGGPVQ
jgi:hypothetical protein